MQIVIFTMNRHCINLQRKVCLQLYKITLNVEDCEFWQLTNDNISAQLKKTHNKCDVKIVKLITVSFLKYVKSAFIPNLCFIPVCSIWILGIPTGSRGGTPSVGSPVFMLSRISKIMRKMTEVMASWSQSPCRFHRLRFGFSVISSSSSDIKSLDFLKISPNFCPSQHFTHISNTYPTMTNRRPPPWS